MYYFLLGWFQNVFGLILGFGKLSFTLAASSEGLSFERSSGSLSRSLEPVYMNKSHRRRFPSLLFAPMRFQSTCVNSSAGVMCLCSITASIQMFSIHSFS